ncbi:TonB-dependent receptor domain-containing protein [Pontibacter pudoricolor]|uniref:TonB-dependent receptor domain-containing protein n=1 Tax=Pontibacter pudoricolor TaxID=2694930 RepID=UPI001390C192|nr:outer membrane beta-barrel family protein [Pontibacter pudoricolor]
MAFLLFFVAHSIFAQKSNNVEANINIKGTVIDSTTNSSLAYVTIVVQEKQTDQVIKHMLTSEKGMFEMTGLAYKEYRLILSYVGYKTKTIDLPAFTSPTINLGVIHLTSTITLLNEVQVVIQKPLVEHDADKVTYNAELDPESTTHNALDLLRKVPLLTVDADDNLQLNGNNSYQVLVNGKRSSLFTGNLRDVLKGLPASAIKKVEVVTNPPARYEASGVGGIINIVTHRKSISGYNGAVNLGVNTPKGYSAGSHITASAGKLNFSARASTSTNTSPGTRSFFFRDDLTRRNRLEQTGESTTKNGSQSGGTELSYDLGPHDNITASYSLSSITGNNSYKQLVEQLDTAGTQTEAYRNLNSSENDGNGYDLSLSYQHTSRKNEEQLLSLLFNLANNDNNSTTDFTLQPVYNYTGRESKTAYNDRSREYALQADYIQPLGKQTLEFGVKSVLEENSSDYFYKTRNPETGEFILDVNQSNDFDYNQDVHAAYISLNLKKGKWGLRSGLRAEQTILDARFRSSGTEVDQNYLSLFPNIMLSFMLKGYSSIKLSYTQRIDRPGLYYLDPYVDLTDPLNISYGNPDLHPATNHTVQAGFDTFFKGTSINASVFHSFTNNSIEQFTTLGTDSVARTTFGNLGQNRNYGLTLSANTTLFKKLNLSLNTGTNYITFTSQLEGKPQTNNGFTYYGHGNVSFRFNRSWRAGGNVGYDSPNILLQGKTGGNTWSSLSVNKDFLKDNKASISLAVRSPFRKTRRALTEITNTAFYQRRESYTEMRQFSLSFNYRFGKLK